MYKKFYTLLTLVLCSMISLSVYAQDSTAAKKVEMADRFRADGKIYVVITVAAIILLGMFLYMVRLDRKIGKFEKEAK